MKKLSTKVRIVNNLGLHARAAAKFVKLASGFSSDVFLRHGHETVNAKSIMSILMLAAGKGTELTLEVHGADQEKAFGALKKLVEDGFGE
jgi:phosphocarrier protein